MIWLKDDAGCVWSTIEVCSECLIGEVHDSHMSPSLSERYLSNSSAFSTSNAIVSTEAMPRVSPTVLKSAGVME